MKKTISIILILSVLYSIFGLQLTFNILQHNIHWQIKLQIRKGLRDDELTLIIPQRANELDWIKPDKEFRYKGNIYDVVRTKQVNNKKYYYCICDKKEEELTAVFYKLQHSKQNRQIPIKKKVKIQLFMPDINKGSDIEQSECFFTGLAFRLTNPHLSKISPFP